MFANKWLGLIPVNPLRDWVVTSDAELVIEGLETWLEAVVTEGLISAAMENKLGLFLVVGSGNSVSSGVAL